MEKKLRAGKFARLKIYGSLIKVRINKCTEVEDGRLFEARCRNGIILSGKCNFNLDVE